MTDQPEMNASASGEVSSDDRLWSALAYVFAPIVSIILLVWEEKKSRPFTRYHAYQSLVLGVIIWAISFVVSLFTAGLLSCLGFILWIAMLYWAYKAFQGEYVQVPFVSEFVKKQGWA